MRAVPKLKELSAKHKDQGLVLIGVHSKKGGEKMSSFVKEKGIGYPVAWDSTGALAEAYGVDGYPDYQVIDRSGNVRVADLANGEVERVIQALLEEPVPSTVPAPLADAARMASKKETRILGVIGSEAEIETVAALAREERSLGQLMRYEYTVAELNAAGHGDLLKAAGTVEPAAALVAYASSGRVLGSVRMEGLDAPRLRRFLEEHRIPQKDAEALWRSALAQAEHEQKRVLVHLGAPW